MTADVTQNPLSVYNAHKNLVLFYLHTDLEKALEKCNELLKLDEKLPALGTKETLFHVGVTHYLKEEYDMAKEYLRKALT